MILPARATAAGVVKDALRGLRGAWRSVLLWCGVSTLLGLASMMLTGRMFAVQAASMRGAPAALGTGAILTLILFGLVFAVVTLMLFTASMRSVLRRADDRLPYLRLSGDELRVAVVAVLVGMGVYIGLTMLVMLLIGLAAAASALLGVLGVVVGVIAAVAGLLCIPGGIYLMTRLSVAIPLTMQSGRIMVRTAWRLSAGRFWFLFGCFALVGLISLLVMIPLIVAQTSSMVSVFRNTGDPIAINRAMAAMMAERGNPASPMALSWLLLGGLANGLVIALQGATSANVLLALQAEAGDRGAAPPTAE